MIIGGIAAAVIVVALTVASTGARRANDAIDRIRTAASTAVLSPADLATFAVGDPGSDPVAEALGLTDELVSASSSSCATWCLAVRVERLLTARTIRFTVDESGRLSETASCPAP